MVFLFLMSVEFSSPNLPLNIPALEALIAMAGHVPQELEQQILSAPLSDDLSGLREMAYRLQEPDEWRGVAQPKQEIGDYVESQGFNVPKRYRSFEEALHAVGRGKTILMRSEHPQEYDGFSGLLHSHVISQDDIDTKREPVHKFISQGLAEDDFVWSMQREDMDWQPIERYLKLTQQDPQDFMEHMSYSFWEYVRGTNIMVVADDSIADRYHMTAITVDMAKGGSSGRGGWITNSDGIETPYDKQFTNIKDHLDPATRATLIELYEAIRTLPRFASRQCPVMELQIGDDGIIYFLQYHKARSFRPSPIRLSPDDYSAAEGWHKADAVRGALGSLVTLKTALWYPSPNSRLATVPTYMPSGREEASFDFHFDIGLTEYASPNRIAYFASKGRQMTYLDMADGAHEVRSRWFKPHGALSLPRPVLRQLISEEKQKEASNAVRLERKTAEFVIDVASDGLKGFVRLNPDAEHQPIYKMA